MKAQTHTIIGTHISLLQDQIGAILSPLIEKLLREYNERQEITEVDMLDANVHRVYDTATEVETVYFGKAPNKKCIAKIKAFEYKMFEGRMQISISIKTFS